MNAAKLKEFGIETKEVSREKQKNGDTHITHALFCVEVIKAKKPLEVKDYEESIAKYNAWFGEKKKEATDKPGQLKVTLSDWNTEKQIHSVVEEFLINEPSNEVETKTETPEVEDHSDSHE